VLEGAVQQTDADLAIRVAPPPADASVPDAEMTDAFRAGAEQPADS
jgi:hypothetical protein